MTTGTIYQIRPLDPSERIAAFSVADARSRWLDRRCLPRNTRAIRDAVRQDADVVAFFEDDDLVGLLQLHRTPALEHWSAEQRAEATLLVSAACVIPGRTDYPGRLMTLWARDFAARLGRQWVRAEVPSPPGGETARLLTYLREACGWQRVNVHTTVTHLTATSPTSSVVLMQCPAEEIPNLSALISSTVSLAEQTVTPAAP
ncbi:hypothetical protein ACFVYR_35945 [Streptomyces sp. NPDC058284]|uniref:hypothetical protein n=1 Tax=unclassified Streptomyces TaxID=2593676 RepID=UPI003669141D